VLWANEQPHVVASGQRIELHTANQAPSSLVTQVRECIRHHKHVRWLWFDVSVCASTTMNAVCSSMNKYI